MANASVIGFIVESSEGQYLNSQMNWESKDQVTEAEVVLREIKDLQSLQEKARKECWDEIPRIAFPVTDDKKVLDQQRMIFDKYYIRKLTTSPGSYKSSQYPTIQ